jgi:hypothetical protein
VELETSSQAVARLLARLFGQQPERGQQPGRQPEIRLPVFWTVAVGRLFFGLPVAGRLPAQTAR